MSALRKIPGLLVAGFMRMRTTLVPSRRIAGTLRVPLPLGLRRCALAAYRSRWFVPALALLALAAINFLYVLRAASENGRLGG
jgi:hypothetical protein